MSPPEPAAHRSDGAAQGRPAELSPSGTWIGASLPRREDHRLLTGRGTFVDDVSRQGQLHACFVRSPLPAARILSIDKAAALATPGVQAVFDAQDLHLTGLTAALERPEFRPTTMPILAEDQVRYQGEPVALVIADSPYSAEDGAEVVDVDYEPLPVTASLAASLAPDAPWVHQDAPGNLFVDLPMFHDPDLDELLAGAALLVSRTFSSGRLSAAPMEARACLAEWVDRDEQLVVHASSQAPHQLRTGIALALGLPERRIRVIAPDVGGGFGGKLGVGREEVAVAAAAHRLRRPVKWAEDRRENLSASWHGHEQEYRVSAGFDADGTIVGLDVDIRCDVGAYSMFPFSCAVEPLMAATEMPGCYKLRRYRARARGVATNKAPTAPYRGVSRPQIVFVMERLMDIAARSLGLSAPDIRRRNLIGPSDFPYQGVTGICYDSGSYRESLDLAERQLESEGWLERREEASTQGRMVGIGYACFSERTAFGTPVMGQRRMTMTPGYDVSHISMDPTGDVVVTSGTTSHGQGHETTFVQIVADQLGIHPDSVKLRQGDTDLVSYGWGTWGSRSIVIGGGAVKVAAERLADRIREVAGHMLEADPADLELRHGRVEVRGDPSAAVLINDVARFAHFRTQELGTHHDSLLEASGSYDPPGTFSNATHAVVAEIDPGTGHVSILRYLVVEDCGVLINPAIVDGQVRGGVAQGIAAALFEELTYEESGQLVGANLMDYLIPTAMEIPPISITHLQTPSAFSATGAKGMGEGGTIGAPAAVVNAVNDALRHQAIELNAIPVRPGDILDLLNPGQSTRGAE
jgi:aerobic carbon-monoxide dehydrogenase large subunit